MVKYSTGRKTKVRHSTATEWDDLEKMRKRYRPIKYATGQEPAVKHATGTEFDKKHLIEEEEKRLEGLCTKVRSKPMNSGDEYVEQHQAEILKERQNRQEPYQPTS